MNIPSLLRRLVCLAIGLLVFRAHGQYSGGGSTGSYSYLPSGPAANYQYNPAYYLNFQVPTSRAGHAFVLRRKLTPTAAPTDGSASAVGIATGPGSSGPQTPLYLAVTAPVPTYP